MKQIFPALFRKYGVRPIEQYSQMLLSTLRSLAPDGRGDPTIVLLTPGVYNSAYYEHAFLARQMGIELVEGRDLVVHDNIVYMRTTKGLQRVDVIYRRVDDDFLDPLAFRVDSLARRRRAVQRLPRRQRHARQRARHRRRRRQGGLRLRAEDHPLLPRSGPDPRQRRNHADDRRRSQRRHVTDRLEQYVVKAVGESGGYGMLIGPHSSQAQREEMRARILADPRNYIAQPVLSLSTAPCFIDGAIEPRHVDLRPVRAVRREDDHRAGRADPGGAAQGLAGRQLVAGRRVQGHLGPPDLTGHALTRCRQPLLDEPLLRAGGQLRAGDRGDARPDAEPRRGRPRPALVPRADQPGPAGRRARSGPAGGDRPPRRGSPEPRVDRVVHRRRARQRLAGARGDQLRDVGAAQPAVSTRWRSPRWTRRTPPP